MGTPRRVDGTSPSTLPGHPKQCSEIAMRLSRNHLVALLVLVNQTKADQQRRMQSHLSHNTLHPNPEEFS